VKAITEELCGHTFSASAISSINKGLESGGAHRHRDQLGAQARSSRVEFANRESQTSRREFLMSLKQRGLSGVEFVVTDDHAGLRNEELRRRTRVVRIFPNVTHREEPHGCSIRGDRPRWHDS
jgi:transposase-like protein